MILSDRVKKIREIRSWKQSAVAEAMKITQQAYSCLEHGSGNARLDTLRRFCDVMNVELTFLLATDVPITDENVEKFASQSLNEIIIGYRKMEQKLEIYEEMISKTMDNGIKMIENNNMPSSAIRA